MRKTNVGIIGFAIEITFLGTGGLIYQNGFRTGLQGAIPMVAGIAVAMIGLLIGGVMGITSMMKEEGNSLAAALAITLPLVILSVIFIRRIGPL